MTKATDGMIAGKPVIRLGNVSKPTISIYRASTDKATGTAVVVCPGGGYHILAMDLEGTEVCDWLNSIGVTAVLLKYRVPERTGLEKHAIAPRNSASTRNGSAHWDFPRAVTFRLHSAVITGSAFIRPWTKQIKRPAVPTFRY
jgi:hypothetical protein